MRRYFPKRLFYSLLVIILWLSFVTSGTFALYQDTAEIEGNAIRTGSASLLVSTSQQVQSELFSEKAQGFSFMLLPGESTERYFSLKNVSPASISLSLTALAFNPSGNTTMEPAVSLEIFPVDDLGNCIGPGVATSFDEFMSHHQPIFDSLARGEQQRFKIKTTLAADYAEEDQTFSYDLLFTGIQVV